MICDFLSYTTLGNVRISRNITEEKIDTAPEEILFHLNQVRGGLLTSSYEYSERHQRWAIGLINPPLQIAARDNTFTITSLNSRCQALLYHKIYPPNRNSSKSSHSLFKELKITATSKDDVMRRKVIQNRCNSTRKFLTTINLLPI